jgi:hypothetical protein
MKTEYSNVGIYIQAYLNPLKAQQSQWVAPFSPQSEFIWQISKFC